MDAFLLSAFCLRFVTSSMLHPSMVLSRHKPWSRTQYNARCHSYIFRVPHGACQQTDLLQIVFNSQCQTCLQHNVSIESLEFQRNRWKAYHAPRNMAAIGMKERLVYCCALPHSIGIPYTSPGKAIYRKKGGVLLLDRPLQACQAIHQPCSIF